MTASLGELETRCNDMSNFVCEKIQDMQNADTNQARQDAYNELVSKQGEMPALLQNVIDLQGRTKGFAEYASTMAQELKETKDELDKIVGIKDMLGSLDVCDSDLKEAAADLNSAKGKIDMIAAIKAKAKEIADKIRKEISPEFRKSTPGKEGLKKVDGFLKRIDVAWGSVQGCPAAPGALWTTLSDLASQLRKSLEGLDLTMKELRQILGEPGIYPAPLSEAMEKAGLIEYLAKMAQQYVNRIKLAQHDAQVCREEAEKLINIMVSWVLPNFSNQPVNQALGTLQGMNIRASPVEQEKASDPQYEYLVKGQDPGQGTEVKIADAHVTLYHYGELDVNAYLARVNCPAGSHPEFDPGSRQARCVCNPGMAPGENGQCIDCNALMGQSQSAYGVNNLDGALQFALMAQNCPGAGEWIGHIQQLRLQAQCQQIEGQIRGLLQMRPPNVNGADALGQRALAMGCNLSADIRSMLNQYLQQRTQQQQQAMADMMQNIFDPNKWLPPDPGPVEPYGGDYQPPSQYPPAQQPTASANTQGGIQDSMNQAFCAGGMDCVVFYGVWDASGQYYDKAAGDQMLIYADGSVKYQGRQVCTYSGLTEVPCGPVNNGACVLHVFFKRDVQLRQLFKQGERCFSTR